MGDDELIRWSWVERNFGRRILPAFLEHVQISLITLVIALAIALPIGIAVSRYRRAYGLVTFVMGLLYTIPSLSFFIMLLSIPGIQIGRTPAIIALVAYSLLILVRNVVVGIDSVPAQVREAARGMGLTSGQTLRQVELPLALPIIVAGIRIATVSTIGVATIAAYIGAGGLGDLIFDGIRRNFTTPMLIGATLATLMAVAVDLGLLGLERRLRPWSRRAARV
jgi:osmoprotectant transport system permease protein